MLSTITRILTGNSKPVCSAQKKGTNDTTCAPTFERRRNVKEIFLVTHRVTHTAMTSNSAANTHT
jgi:hypothetical protein